MHGRFQCTAWRDRGHLRDMTTGDMKHGGMDLAKRLLNLLLPLSGIGMAVALWWAASLAVADLPSPARTWEESKVYILEPLTKRGEMDQRIVLLAYYSLMRVARAFLLGIA